MYLLGIIGVLNVKRCKESKLSIQSNTIYGLIGMNGYGKSSLLKQIVTLQNMNPTTESVKIDTLYVEQEIKLV